MPIRINADLPAKKILEHENIFVMDYERSLKQDIRPLKIIIMNLMPTKQATELQLLRSLSNTPLQVDITFLKTETHDAQNESQTHMETFYTIFPEIRQQYFDGLIITGAPVETLDFEEVDYWPELVEIMEWSKTHVTSTFHICWAAPVSYTHLFTEIVSVSVHALRRFERFTHARKNVVGIWGDGNLGYITAVFFHYMHPDTKLVIFGTNEDKLSGFTFADETHLVWEIPEDLKVDHAIECVGGDASQKAIDQMIDIIQPEGTIALLGVSEYAVPINTRMVLEKGLHLYGSSRSGRADFEETVEMYQEYPEILGYLSNIVGAQVEVNSIADMTRAFEMDINKVMGKTIMIWNK